MFKWLKLLREIRHSLLLALLIDIAQPTYNQGVFYLVNICFSADGKVNYKKPASISQFGYKECGLDKQKKYNHIHL